MFLKPMVPVMHTKMVQEQKKILKKVIIFLQMKEILPLKEHIHLMLQV